MQPVEHFGRFLGFLEVRTSSMKKGGLKRRASTPIGLQDPNLVADQERPKKRGVRLLVRLDTWSTYLYY